MNTQFAHADQFFNKHQPCRLTGFIPCIWQLFQDNRIRQAVLASTNQPGLTHTYKYQRGGGTLRADGVRPWAQPAIPSLLAAGTLWEELAYELRDVRFPIYPEVVYPTLSNVSIGAGHAEYERRLSKLTDHCGAWIVTIDFELLYSSICEENLEPLFQRFSVSRSLRERLFHWIAYARRGSIPLGQPLSELLAMIALQPLDELLVDLGFEWFRLMDDVRIVAPDRETGEYILRRYEALAREFMYTLNAAKTFVHEPAQLPWLAVGLVPRDIDPALYFGRGAFGRTGGYVLTEGLREGESGPLDQPELNAELFLRDFGRGRIVESPSIERKGFELLRDTRPELAKTRLTRGILAERPYLVQILARGNRQDEWTSQEANELLNARIHTLCTECMLLAESVSANGGDAQVLFQRSCPLSTMERARYLRTAPKTLPLVALQVDLESVARGEESSEICFAIAKAATKEDGRIARLLKRYLQRTVLGIPILEVVAQA